METSSSLENNNDRLKAKQHTYEHSCKCKTCAETFDSLMPDFKQPLLIKAKQETKEPEIKFCEWISVKDRLPDSSNHTAEQVIVCSKPEGKEALVICAVYYLGDFYLQEKWDTKQLLAPKLKHTTHWMPLPSPPNK